MAKSFEESLNDLMATSAVAASAVTMSLRSTSTEDSGVMLLSNEDDDSWTPIDDGTYTWYDENDAYHYIDDQDVSTIDKTKNVKLNKEQINLTQETNSQVISFEMDRRWDNIDLTKMKLRINYVNSEGNGSFSYPINVKYNDSKIRFLWLIDDTATAVEGSLQFEIYASGTVNGKNYTWRTRPNGDLKVLKSLEGNSLIEPSQGWDIYLNQLDEKVRLAETAAATAEAAATSAASSAKLVEDKLDATAQYVVENVKQEIESDIAETYVTKIDAETAHSEINERIDNIDGLAAFNSTYDDETGIITFYNGEEAMTYHTLMTNPTEEWTENFRSTIQNLIDPLSSELSTYKVENDAKVKQNTDDIENIKENYATKDELENVQVDLSDYYTKDEVAEAYAAKTDVTKLQSDVAGLTESVELLDENLQKLDSEMETLGENIAHPVPSIEWSEDTRTLSLLIDDDVQQSVTISGGGGGGSTEGSTVTIERISPTTASMTVLSGNSAPIEYGFTSVDTSNEETGDGTAVWTVGTTKVATVTVTQGSNTFDPSAYLSFGSNKVKVTITDSFGNIATKIWTINVIEFKIESTFDDSVFYSGDVTFRYVPYGDATKLVHFILDSKEIATYETAITGRQLTQTISGQSHGAHLLEVYMTATINSEEVQSNSIYRDIIWIDTENTTPVIGCSIYSIVAKQYNTTTIPYVVYDPQNNPANITLLEDGETLYTLIVDRTQQVWSYKSNTSGTKTLSIVCGETVKEISAVIEDLGIKIEPVTTNLVFDFNPSGNSNNDVDRLWTDGTYSISVSDDFDWTNGGYQIDSDGDTYFCVKAGTTATLDYKLFADDAKDTGKNFKIIYKITNVRDYDALAFSCYQGGIGFRIQAQEATLNSELNSVTAPAVEENPNYTKPIEMELNILPAKEYTEMVLWTNAVPTRAKPYATTDNFTQPDPVGITIGSEDCDIQIYRMKAYTMNLTDDEILDNYIADAKNADEMINRYLIEQIVNANGDIDADILAKNCPDLRVLKISAPTFAVDKTAISNTVVEHIFKGGRAVTDNWVGVGKHKGQGTSSIAYLESALNIDIDISSFEFADGSTGTSYAMTENSIPESYFNIKVNVASSENANNSRLADDYNEFNPYRRTARINDSRVRDCMEFHPCAIFLQETDTENATVFTDGKWHFYACGDFGNSKKNSDAMGMDPNNHKEVIVEVLNNTDAQTLFLSDDLSAELWGGKQSFEFRYINDNCTEDEIQEAKDAWQTLLTWVVNATPETFVAEFEDHFIKNSVLFFYLFTERHCMVDNRAKNTFWHTEDLIHWDICFNYDNDTAEGCNNTGGLTLTYGLEDIDTIGDGYVFNAANSKIWCYVRDYMFDDLQAMYQSLDTTLVWRASRFIKKMRDYQEIKPKRLVIADMRRKYFRTYEDNGTTSYLEMMHGDKELKMIQFEYYQDPYIASKYMGSTCVSDAITIRGYTPTTWAGVEPNGDLHITPYADVYIVVKYGTGYIVRQRAKRNTEYLIECPISEMNDTEVYPYSASMFKSIGDISGFYPRILYADNGVKLTTIIAGSDAEGYSNSNMKEFTVNNNILLEYLDIRNTPNLAQSMDLSNCANLETFYADGSGITGVIFAPGGKIKIAHLPETIISITAKNLNFMEDLEIEGYDNITTLTIENCSSIDALDIINNSPNLNRIRVTGIDWTLADDTLLNTLLGMTGINENGYNTTQSVLAGKVYVPIVKEKLLEQYHEAWSDLEISYKEMVNQYTVTFQNYDGKVLNTQYVTKGEVPVDPVAAGLIDVPTRESSVSTVFTYSGWDQVLTTVFANMTFTAVYDESVRKYTVQYKSEGTLLGDPIEAEYGTYVYYEGETPTYTTLESNFVYSLFRGWDDDGYVDGDKVINAVYDTMTYTDGYYDDKDLSEMSMVELYALTTSLTKGSSPNVDLSSVVEMGDSLTFNMGVDFDYEGIESQVLIEDTMDFTGSNYFNTGIQLFDEDKDFVLAVDYEFGLGNSAKSTLIQCYQSDGSDGFEFTYSTNPTLSWGNSSTAVCATGTNREMLVLRHIKGETGLHVYISNLSDLESGYVELARDDISTITDATLIFGCKKILNGDYYLYQNNAIGKIHWAKVWMTDLGDAACKDLVNYIHEKITVQLCNTFNRNLSDVASTLNTMSFLGAHTLYAKRAMNNTAASNSGGFPESDLFKWLEARFYPGMPNQLKQLVKKVKVSCSIGDGSTSVTTCNCHIYIPSIIEIFNSASCSAVASAPYINEDDDTISFMSSSDARIRTDADGNAVEYWTRSTSGGTNASRYYYRVSAGGSAESISQANNTYGVVIEFSI